MAAKTGTIHDIIIAGAGAAGLSACVGARAREATVGVLEPPRRDQVQSPLLWISPAAVAVAGELGVDARAAKAVSITGLRVFSADLKKNAAINDKDIALWAVERRSFLAALRKKAAAAGATFVEGEATAVALGEDRVTLTIGDGRTLVGRVLLIADGLNSPTARLANIPTAGRSPDLALFLAAHGPGMKGNAGLDVAIGAGKQAQIMTIVRSGAQTHVTLVARLRPDAAGKAFSDACAAATAAGLLPQSLSAPATGPIALGTALDVESHVGKRTLLIGDAGGFVSAFSAEGVYPAMRSGLIAAEVAARAIKSRWVQDELATFGEAWRTALADYMRMPNTDLSLLMPLVFNNAQLSARVARAFVLGQQF
ncbi:MAG: hypothetical protein HZB38_19055 [Planctomycetes bacterium]|nr:hypothetical protein [Planctomycetota bacterium]